MMYGKASLALLLALAAKSAASAHHRIRGKRSQNLRKLDHKDGHTHGGGSPSNHTDTVDGEGAESTEVDCETMVVCDAKVKGTPKEVKNEVVCVGQTIHPSPQWDRLVGDCFVEDALGGSGCPASCDCQEMEDENGVGTGSGHCWPPGETATATATAPTETATGADSSEEGADCETMVVCDAKVKGTPKEVKNEVVCVGQMMHPSPQWDRRVGDCFVGSGCPDGCDCQETEDENGVGTGRGHCWPPGETAAAPPETATAPTDPVGVPPTEGSTIPTFVDPNCHAVPGEVGTAWSFHTVEGEHPAQDVPGHCAVVCNHAPDDVLLALCGPGSDGCSYDMATNVGTCWYPNAEGTGEPVSPGESTGVSGADPHCRIHETGNGGIKLKTVDGEPNHPHMKGACWELCADEPGVVCGDEDMVCSPEPDEDEYEDYICVPAPESSTASGTDSGTEAAPAPVEEAATPTHKIVGNGRKCKDLPLGHDGEGGTCAETFCVDCPAGCDPDPEDDRDGSSFVCAPTTEQADGSQGGDDQGDQDQGGGDDQGDQDQGGDAEAVEEDASPPQYKIVGGGKKCKGALHNTCHSLCGEWCPDPNVCLEDSDEDDDGDGMKYVWECASAAEADGGQEDLLTDQDMEDASTNFEGPPCVACHVSQNKHPYKMHTVTKTDGGDCMNKGFYFEAYTGSCEENIEKWIGATGESINSICGVDPRCRCWVEKMDYDPNYHDSALYVCHSDDCPEEVQLPSGETVTATVHHSQVKKPHPLGKSHPQGK